MATTTFQIITLTNDTFVIDSSMNLAGVSVKNDSAVTGTIIGTQILTNPNGTAPIANGQVFTYIVDKNTIGSVLNGITITAPSGCTLSIMIATECGANFGFQAADSSALAKIMASNGTLDVKTTETTGNFWGFVIIEDCVFTTINGGTTALTDMGLDAGSTWVASSTILVPKNGITITEIKLASGHIRLILN